jgi:transposase
VQKEDLIVQYCNNHGGKFFEFFEYKLKRNGGELIKVNPKHTSKKCSRCRYILKEIKKRID